MSNPEQDAIDYLKSAVSVPIAYLTLANDLAQAPNANPLEVSFVWDEEGAGEIARMDVGAELLDWLRDDPARYAEAIPKVVAALRKLADQIEAIPKPQADG